MNLDQLSYPIAIAASGSLSAAAKELGISQSALSRYLEKLEQEVGMPLFTTSRRKMYPTKAGRAYIRTARQILELMESTRARIARLEHTATRTLRVGISPHSGARIFSQVYMDFSSRYPDTKLQPVEGYSGELKEKLSRGECDAVFTSGEEEPNLDSYPIFRTEIVLAIPRALDSPRLPREELAEDFLPLRGSVFVMPEEPDALCKYVNSLLQRAEFHPQVQVKTPNVMLQRQLISSGAGIGFLPLYHAEADPSLRVLHLRNPVYMTTGMFCRKGTVLTPELEYLLFLCLRESIQKQSNAVWNRLNRQLIREYAPETAQELEEVIWE